MPSEAQTRVQLVCLVILAGAALGAALYWLRPVLIPFMLALFVALAISPLVEWQTRYLRFPQPLALLSTGLLVVLVFAGLAMLLTASVNQLAASAEAYEVQLNLLFDRLTAALPDALQRRLPQEEWRKLISLPASTVGPLLALTTNAFLGLVSQGLGARAFVLILLICGGGWSRQEQGMLGEVVSRVRRYLVVTVAISGATGALVAVILSALGVPLALVFGLLAFLLNFVPNVGSVIATLLPLPVVIISPEVSSSAAILAIAIPGTAQFIIGYGIAPKVLGDSLDLHPVVILLALIFWSTLWGLVGMLLATPITASIKILLERFETTRVVAEVMAGRWEEPQPASPARRPGSEPTCGGSARDVPRRGAG